MARRVRQAVFVSGCATLCYRAGDRTRTGDVQLGKLAFYQLNYARDAYVDESHRSGLNRRPLDYESSALPLSYGGGRERPGAESSRAAIRHHTLKVGWLALSTHT